MGIHRASISAMRAAARRAGEDYLQGQKREDAYLSLLDKWAVDKRADVSLQALGIYYRNIAERPPVRIAGLQGGPITVVLNVPQPTQVKKQEG